MDDLSTTLSTLSAQLSEAANRDPLEALQATSAAQRVVGEHQRQAIRLAARSHSWSEIGEALGVTKQAAHQRYAKEWATELKVEAKEQGQALKAALKRRDYRVAAEAQERFDAIIAEFKDARQANRKRSA